MKSTKNTIKLITILLLSLSLLLCFAACEEEVDATGLWENATYRSDTTVGEGADTVKVEIVAGEQSITLTLKTDKATLGEALYEHGIVNDPSFFDTCNGIKADWDKDQAYWAFYVGGEMAMYGIGDVQAVTANAPEYKIVYTK